MIQQLFNALKAIDTLASGTTKVYGLPSGHGLDRRTDIISAVKALALGQSINLHSALI